MTCYVAYPGSKCFCPESKGASKTSTVQPKPLTRAFSVPQNPKTKVPSALHRTTSVRIPSVPIGSVSKSSPNLASDEAAAPTVCPAHNPSTGDEIEQVARAILNARRCVVVSGAGISCSAGIPDFRSQNGLFSTLKERHSSHINQGRDLFDAQLFQNEATTRIFHQFIGQFKQSIAHVRPTTTHQFLQWLHSQGRLTRWYTQNIDGLEAKTGLSVLGQLRPRPSDPADPVSPDEETIPFMPKEHDPLQRKLVRATHPQTRASSPESVASSQTSDEFPLVNPLVVSTAANNESAALPSPCTPSRILRDPRATVVPLHGDLDQLVCQLCSTYYPFTPAFFAMYQRGEAPVCPHCDKLNRNRALAGRRAISVGRLRPNIVLYNEPHPSGDLIAKVMNNDVRHRPDLLLILGTRLNVYGCKALVKSLAKTVHQHKKGQVIMVNLEPMQTKEWDSFIDVQVLAPADDLIRDIIRVRDAQTCLTHFWELDLSSPSVYPRSPLPRLPVAKLKRANSLPIYDTENTTGCLGTGITKARSTHPPPPRMKSIRSEDQSNREVADISGSIANTQRKHVLPVKTEPGNELPTANATRTTPTITLVRSSSNELSLNPMALDNFLDTLSSSSESDDHHPDIAITNNMSLEVATLHPRKRKQKLASNGTVEDGPTLPDSGSPVKSIKKETATTTTTAALPLCKRQYPPQAVAAATTGTSTKPPIRDSTTQSKKSKKKPPLPSAGSANGDVMDEASRKPPPGMSTDTSTTTSTSLGIPQSTHNPPPPSPRLTRQRARSTGGLNKLIQPAKASGLRRQSKHTRAAFKPPLATEVLNSERVTRSGRRLAV
ncbi:NAD-dependent deacetylase hst3 [Dispira parvispora]|uniref:NAD-dependent deacetylase hst3 n=1 Tax=Dispira parvispora TaxID=1520584 RepID=A0A9W8AXG4_9FUNG|nr:NAD-dependent deacetylase hst3 [Dispira parvispora]